MKIKNIKISKKMFMVLFTMLSTYLAYYLEIKIPDNVSLAIIGMVSAYLPAQAWVDSNILEKE